MTDKKIKDLINPQLLELIALDEGWRGKAYDDATGLEVKAPFGALTIGFGFNVQDMPLPKKVAYYWLEVLLEDVFLPKLLEVLPDLPLYNLKRRNHIISMYYNLGHPRFMKFKLMIAAIKKQDWKTAAAEAKNSLWAREQVGNRAVRTINALYPQS